MNTDVTVSVETQTTYVRIVARGAIVTSAYTALRDSIDEAIVQAADGRRAIVLDFTEASMISSTCINVINSRRKIVQDRGIELIIIAPPDARGEIFDLTGYSILLPVFRSLEEFLNHKGIRG